ncbi:hypothetical protein BDZ89DRAFT_1139732 [Hymenopellis radicata]|nr:hypothetical protein BDZ89DRAFT_1139732 [Hymenopellis radicata]
MAKDSSPKKNAAKAVAKPGRVQTVFRFNPTPLTGRKCVERRLRALRPIRTDYELGSGKFYTRGAEPAQPPAETTFTRPPQVGFIQVEVGRWLEHNHLNHLEEKFRAMGVFSHEDLVNLVLDIRNQENRVDFRIGSEEEGDAWHHLKRCLYRYARRVES